MTIFFERDEKIYSLKIILIVTFDTLDDEMRENISVSIFIVISLSL